MILSYPVVVVRYILDLTRLATVKLQRKEIDLLKAEQEISSLRENLEDLHANVDEKHHELYVQAVKLPEAVGLRLLVLGLFSARSIGIIYLHQILRIITGQI